jgi:hypothetical protein
VIVVSLHHELLTAIQNLASLELEALSALSSHGAQIATSSTDSSAARFVKTRRKSTTSSERGLGSLRTIYDAPPFSMGCPEKEPLRDLTAKKRRVLAEGEMNSDGPVRAMS